jgi:hypothetical protein
VQQHANDRQQRSADQPTPSDRAHRDHSPHRRRDPAAGQRDPGPPRRAVFPALLLGWQWLRARCTPTRLQATGPIANLANVAVFLALYLTPDYAPALSATSDAALLFYGASMLLAAVRGYAGCEVLAVSNWLLRRDDQIGCLLFWPIDHAERRRTHAGMPASR